jgi:broad specificity phosphatase PhoE
VDEDRPELAGEDGRGETFPGSEEVDWDAGYAGFARLFERGGQFAAFAAAQAAVWRAIARSLSTGGRALIVGHGGFIEAAAVAAFPDADHAAWGRSVRHCEGVLVQVDQDGFANLEILRVPKDLRKRRREGT